MALREVKLTEEEVQALEDVLMSDIQALKEQYLKNLPFTLETG